MLAALIKNFTNSRNRVFDVIILSNILSNEQQKYSNVFKQQKILKKRCDDVRCEIRDSRFEIRGCEDVRM